MAFKYIMEKKKKKKLVTPFPTLFFTVKGKSYKLYCTCHLQILKIWTSLKHGYLVKVNMAFQTVHCYNIHMKMVQGKEEHASNLINLTCEQSNLTLYHTIMTLNDPGNIGGKQENAEAFSPFQTIFSILPKTNFDFSVTFILSSASSFNLKFFRSVKG